ncbi:MAG: hypothetical protein A3K19_06675 [Lentisphaerae bacterium RIFOXYB12_FULL_65_16]|nr:MAG: hypothetical protein A3K18_07825 [Lentisphaerae bacterium RIFOXYA12_64_32]OGV93123.1 MAG: hypothetical protein A3K19_06675 [Lentisphaerae bacterium RIFOXYB12_FULL_65_16]
MRNTLATLAVGMASAFASAADESQLPHPPPPFLAEAGKPAPPELKVMSIAQGNESFEQPSLWIGNKRIGFRERGTLNRDQAAQIMVDNHEVFGFQFWGAAPPEGNFGYPFRTADGTTPQLRYDKAQNSITYSKAYVQANGESATFAYTVKAVGDSQIEVSWDLGVPQDKFEADPKGYAGVSPWFMSSTAYRQEQVRINGSTVKFSDTALLTGDKETPGPAGTDGFELVYAPDKPLRSFSIKFPGYYEYAISERLAGGGACSVCIRVGTSKRLAADKFTISFGDVVGRADTAPPPVAGIDFWEHDRFCVPASTTRNIMPNPSFEQGLRFWTWWWGGGKYNPSDIPAYSASTDARFGQSAIWIRPGKGAQPLASFMVPVIKGTAYTVSVYAKAEKPGVAFSLGIQGTKGSRFGWMTAFQTKHTLTTTKWERKSFTFTADCAGVNLLLSTGQNLLIDGLQFETGNTATDFVAPDIEAALATSDPDNNLARGQPIRAGLTLRGTANAQGDVHLQLFNYYRERLYDLSLTYTLDATGSARLELPYDGAQLGTGVFVLQADFQPSGGPTDRNYYRFSIMDFLENKHADKDVFGTLCHAPRITRGNDLIRNYMRWGFGSTTYGWHTQEEFELYNNCRVANFLLLVCDLAEKEDREFTNSTKSWKEITPEIEARVEEISYKVVKSHPWGISWAWSTESEGGPIIASGRFDEWAKVQFAAWRGIKKANPNAVVLPDGGTSGFSRLRGYREMDGYLKATRGKVKWDAMAVHPYGPVDAIDGCTDMLNEIMARYGYDKSTPIDYTEGFNCTHTKIPEWGDDGCYDNYQGGKPSYDFGWREYLHAANAARVYLACLKGWPQVRSFNIWVSAPFMDQYLTPLALCQVPNTLGHLLPKPRFKADVLPAAGVKGHVFEDEQGRGVAAVWCITAKVQEGLEKGPTMSVNFGGDVPEFIDLMGNVRPVVAQNGFVDIPLTPAPLFMRSAAGGADKLAAALNAADVSGAGNALMVTVQPAPDGSIEAVAENLTGKELKGQLQVGANDIAFDIKAKDKFTAKLQERVDPAPGKLNAWHGDIAAEFPDKRKDTSSWDMQFLFVPHTVQPLPLDPAAPDWDKVPAVKMTNFYGKTEPGKETVKSSGPGDLDAQFQLAWDNDNLYLRVSAVDDAFVVTEPERFRQSIERTAKLLYMHDGCVEVYLDTGANGRSNPLKGYDADDYRYDFSPGNDQAGDGPGAVYRLYEPYHQLAGGLEMPKKDEAAQGVKCQFSRDGNRYAYCIILPQRYIEPLKLEKGWRAGFALYIHDKDKLEEQWPPKGMSLATEPGAHCDRRPDLWPIMILTD